MERLMFSPQTDNVEVLLNDVKQTVCQFNHYDIAIWGLIKSCMHADIYGTLYQAQDLDVAVAMVKDIDDKKSEHTTAIRTTPFSMYHSSRTNPQKSEGANPRDIFSETSLFYNAVDRLVKQCPN